MFVTNNLLLDDIYGCFGEDLVGLSYVDSFWLMSQLAQIYFNYYAEDSQSYDCDDVVDRLYELSIKQKECLLLALVNNKQRPLGYWGCDSSNSLIEEISDTFGDCLNKLDEFDRFWLIARLAYEVYMIVDGSVSDGAEEIIERVDELSRLELENLIEAIANS